MEPTGQPISILLTELPVVAIDPKKSVYLLNFGLEIQNGSRTRSHVVGTPIATAKIHIDVFLPSFVNDYEFFAQRKEGIGFQPVAFDLNERHKRRVC